MDNAFFVSKGFRTDGKDPDWRGSHEITLIGTYHETGSVSDCEIVYCFNYGRWFGRFLEALRKEGCYRDDLDKALITRFGKKIDDQEFSSFLKKNKIRYSRDMDKQPRYPSFAIPDEFPDYAIEELETIPVECEATAVFDKYIDELIHDVMPYY